MRSLCAACGQKFSGLTLFDRHRVGPWAARKCLSHEEMVQKGMVLRKDAVWSDGSAPLGNWWKKGETEK